MPAKLTPAQARKKHNDTFQKFWLAYPRHTHINEAMDIWSKLMEEGADAARIVGAARRFAANQASTDMKYVPGPQNWLKAGQYDDADIFQDEQSAIKTWFQQQWKTANVKAVQDRVHVQMPKMYPPDEMTEPDAIRFWFRGQAQLWIMNMYKEKYENVQVEETSQDEPSEVLF